MKRLCHTLLIATIVASMAMQATLAEDVIVLPNKKEIRCKITEFSGGLFTYEDASGKVMRIGPSALSRIKFDAPEAAAVFGAGTAAGVSIEQVNAFPEKFAGQTLIFPHCDISQELSRLRESDYFALSLTSKGGQYITPIIGRDRITFIVPKSLAEKFSAQIQGGFTWPDCTVKCTIQKMNLEKKDVIVALVSRIDVFNRGGKVGITFTE